MNKVKIIKTVFWVITLFVALFVFPRLDVTECVKNNSWTDNSVAVCQQSYTNIISVVYGIWLVVFVVYSIYRFSLLPKETTILSIVWIIIKSIALALLMFVLSQMVAYQGG